ncbi:F-actin-capping protein subunit alpha [Acarospora aff. strigata]|nr:F-actin-capping protein subunit alpha [Acarospora aff. strigata]
MALELINISPDIKALTADEPRLLHSANSVFQKYNEEQLTTVKLSGSNQQVIVSSYNALGDGRYYDVESQSSFAFDHATQKASDVQTHTLDSQHSDLIKSLLKSLATHAREHYPSSTYGVYPTDSDSAIAILLVANKYSPNNFWNGRYRSLYTFHPASTSSSTSSTNAPLTGSIKLDVHYYEDGNVRLITTKPLSLSLPSSASSSSTTSSSLSSEIIRAIATAEKKYQEEVNRAFASLSEGAFKGLRRSLPVTRQKVEWEKIGGYRLGQDIGGGRAR